MKTVKYQPREGYMVPSWRVGEKREVTDERAETLLLTGHFLDVSEKVKAKPKKTEVESDS